MAAAKKCWPLSKATDGAHWDTADLFGRLCIVADAAFLSAGFQPCAAPETTPWSVSRRYALPQLTHREGADAAVLCVSRRGRRRGGCGRGKVEVDAYVDCHGRQRNVSRERLPLAALAPVVSGGMDDTSRALTTPSSPDDATNGGGAWWLWRLFADQLSRRLFLSICLHSGVTVLPSFACLPVDLQVTILRRLRVAEDVARVECASKELRRLVADHDALLWKAKYDESIRFHYPRRSYISSEEPAVKPPPFFTDEDMAMALMSWKERYAMTRWQAMVMTTWRFWTSSPMPTWKPRVPSAERARLQTIIDMVRRRCAQHNSPQHHDRPADQPRTVARTSSDHGWRGTTTVDDRSSRRTMETVVLSSKPYRKGNGAGAVHSPSSRHRWNHR